MTAQLATHWTADDYPFNHGSASPDTLHRALFRELNPPLPHEVRALLYAVSVRSRSIVRGAEARRLLSKYPDTH